MDALALADTLTLDEQISLMSGEDFWSVPAIAAKGIGKLRVSDGPNGARGGGSLIGGVKAASFPVGIAIGATWNVALASEIGAALAGEAKSKGAHMLLAPTINIHRSVTNGRNFECYSEDPVLTGQLAVAYVTGLQGQGVAATVKHFVGNESEIERTTVNSQIDERTLREVYLLPFEMAVKEGKTWGVMSSYNKLNGTYTAENGWLLTQVLRREWGYDGIVMSDWFGSRTTAPTVNAGLDLEMPGPARDRGAKLADAVQAGRVPAEKVRQAAANMLRVMGRTGALSNFGPHEEFADDRPENRALIRRAGAEAMVLLKNRDGILPLAGSGKIAVIGPNARIAQIMGGGSAQLNPHHAISPWQGLREALGEDRLAFAQGCTNTRFEPLVEGRLKAEYFANADFSGEPVHTETLDDAQAFMFGRIGGGKVDATNFSLRLTGIFTPSASGVHRCGIFSAGRSRLRIDGQMIADAWTDWQPGRTFFEEGCDEVIGEIGLEAGKTVPVVIEFASNPARNLGFAAFRAGIGLPLGDSAIAEAVETARHAETVLVFAGRNGEWDTEGSDLTDIRLPGRQDALIAALAAANPRTIVVLQTGGPVEMPWLDDVAAVIQAWYPGQEAGYAIADVLTGAASPGGRLPQSFPRRWQDNPAHSQDKEVYPGLNGKVRYEEGVFIGYRHYDRMGIEPLFPFGFGLSYTAFAWSPLRITPDGDGFIAEIDVANTGKRPGYEVVQFYVSDRNCPVPRPEKELKAFVKLALEPGETKTARVRLTPRDFAWFDVEASAWRARAGDFSVFAAASAADMRSNCAVTRPAAWMDSGRPNGGLPAA